VASSCICSTTLSFRVGAAHIQALAACREELEAGRFSDDRLAKCWPRWAPWKAPSTRYAAAAFLNSGINAGVSSVRPRLERVDPSKPEAVVTTISKPETLLSLCAVELFNHLVADRRLLYCRNETCGRLFTMQEGRAKYGIHRTDLVQYHSAACARAQAQREYRRRKGSQAASRKGGKR
jgi:hypothetical protein